MPPVIYRINKTDVISMVNQGWKIFAVENHAESLAYNSVVGSRLWDHIQATEVRQLYTIIFNNVRKSEHTIKLPYRCDSPACRRHMEMTIIPFSSGELEIQNTILREEKRPALDLYNPVSGKSKDLIRMCSWCNKVSMPEWVEVEDAVAKNVIAFHQPIPNITHGICPNCRHAVLQKLEEETGLIS